MKIYDNRIEDVKEYKYKKSNLNSKDNQFSER